MSGAPDDFADTVAASVSTLDGPSPAAEDKPPRTEPRCLTCGEPVTWGGRGRPPRYHPEHRPGKSGTSSPAPKAAGGRVSKAEREADEVRVTTLKVLTKASVLVSVVEPFDGVALYAGSPELATQLRGVLVTHDALRAEMLSWSAGGSVLGLVLATAMIALPILAHHHVIPATIHGRPVGEMLEQLPATLMRFNKSADAASDSLDTVMEAMRAKAEADAAKVSEAARQNAASNGHVSAPNGYVE